MAGSDSLSLPIDYQLNLMELLYCHLGEWLEGLRGQVAFSSFHSFCQKGTHLWS